VIHKTEGIVLRTLKYQEAGMITTVYTREYGIRTFIIRTYRSSRSRNKYSFFQPLSIIDLIYFYKENRDIHSINESKTAVLLQEVQAHPVKLSLGLAMVEIFYDCIKEEEQNLPLYDFFRRTILYLDKSEKHLIHIFIFFLLHLTQFLGFFPNDESDAARHVAFDSEKGTLTALKQQADPVPGLLRRFMESELETCYDITFDQQEKRFLLKTLFAYYKTHVQGFRYPQTIRVFAEVFGDLV
jgi:DNA repair protein RecO (recombination protein O)